MSEEAAVRREVVPMNLLVVDDEQSIRETCATVSEQCGMKAVAVATAKEELEVFKHSAIDILLTDLKLQQTNGVELLKQVHDVHPEVAVVAFPSNFIGAAGMTRGRPRSRANRCQTCGGERCRRGE
jgi:response regulator RpfG family c-di-GMP phosphodiesterase